MEQIDYAELLPPTPPVDLVGWLREQGQFNNDFLIYKAGSWYDPLEDRKKAGVEVVCSACGEKFFADKVSAGGCCHAWVPAPFGWFNVRTRESVIDGVDTLCPCCGRPAKTVHIGSGLAHSTTTERWVAVVGRVSVPGKRDRLTVTDWLVRRFVSRDGLKSYQVDPYFAYVVEERKIVRLMGYTKFMSRVSLLGHLEQRRNYADCMGPATVYPFDPSLPDGTTAENCRLDLYLEAGGLRPVSWLALWQKHPAAENLLVQGAGKILCGLLEKEMADRSYSCYSGTSGNPTGVPRLPAVNWKERRPARMLGLNREEFRTMLAEEWSAEELERYKMLRNAGVVTRPEDMAPLKDHRTYELNCILEEGPRADFWRTIRYLNRQRSDWSILRDYRAMARQLGRDLDEGLVRWPRDLKQAHDLCDAELARIRAEKEAAENEKRIKRRASAFRARYEALEPLSWLERGLLIRPCADERELIAEGAALHHCVARYADDIVRKKTAIFFIRRADAPERPFYTLELDEQSLTVRQNRGLRNCARTPEVEEFEGRWLEWLRRRGAKARAKVGAA